MSSSIRLRKPLLSRRLLAVHRWLSLAAATFWLIQAITGVLIVFHWEIDDATISSLHRPTDLAALERRMVALVQAGPDREVSSLWVTAGLADRYDIFVTDKRANTERVIRVAGDGTILRARNSEELGFTGVLVTIHHTLFAGEPGEWIVGISGILLFTNLLLGAALAWPRRGAWRRALAPTNHGGVPARLYSWHRALGLWIVLPGLFLVGTGVLLRFEETTATIVGAQPVAMPPVAPGNGGSVGFAAAVRAAQQALPGSSLTSVDFPKVDDATYRIGLRAPGELRRAYGASIVFVDAGTGAVRRSFPARDADGPRFFMDALFSIHTGESGGIVGRLLVLALGLWIAVMVVLGGALWIRRRRVARQS